MNAYIYQAALLCEDCGVKVKDHLDQQGDAPADPEDEYSYDSDDYPKGPYSEGGGESDSPSHCDICHEFLENPLTEEGDQYVRDAWADGIFYVHGPGPAVQEWYHYYTYLF